VTHWWIRDDMTGPGAVAQAATAAGILVAQIHLEDRPTVVVTAHGGPWGVFPGEGGWWAEQLLWIALELRGWPPSPARWAPIPDTDGWLGVADLEPEQIVRNLVDASELPLYARVDGQTRSTERVDDWSAHSWVSERERGES
jgi:hypothetical protein